MSSIEKKSIEKFEDHCWKDILTPDLVEIYKNYVRDTYIGKKPALLVVDLYNRAYQGGPVPIIDLQDTYPNSCGIVAWNAIPPTQGVLSLARSKGIPVIYSTDDIREGQRVTPTKRKGADRNNPNDFEIKEEFKPQKGDLIVYKQRASAFFGTPLIAQLKMIGADSLIVVGESTSGCVRAAVLDAYNYGYHVTVVEECCFDRSPISHKVNLFDMHHKYADVMHFEEVKEHLSSLR